MIDLTPTQKDLVKSIVGRYMPGSEILAYGSRVAGKSKRFSDLDIAIKSSIPIPALVLFQIKSDLSESDLPFRVDILDWQTTSEEFREIIRPQLVAL